MNATLHTLNISSRENSAVIDRLLRCASTGDSVLLIENGVYTLADDNALQAFHAAGLALYALQVDIDARGLQHHIISSPVTLLDDSGFVALACEHHKTVSWFA
ncbi:MAG TPA: sulfurtransferase complex subunit TusB [Pseudomonadales bacterium]|nr:sulfurtransferase complex subunit TusB [Pseudomonadales bacterium]